MKRILVVAAIVCAASTQVFAQWMYQEKESAFTGKKGALMFAVNSSDMGFGFRCRADEGKMKIVFITPERVEKDELLAVANMSGPKILIRVDNHAPHSIAAEAIKTNSGQLSLIADASPELVDEVAKARKRIAVAMKLLGDTYHETSFSPRGSGRVGKKFLTACDSITKP